MTRTCEICAFIDENGYYPRIKQGRSTAVISGGHCRSCHRTWMGSSEVHCEGGCCRQFSGIVAYDAHRVGDVCRDPSALKMKDGETDRFRIVKRKHGYVWVSIDHRPSDASGVRQDETERPAATGEHKPRSVAAGRSNSRLSEVVMIDEVWQLQLEGVA